MEPCEWSLAAASDVIARAASERPMLVWKDVRRTHGEVADRTRGLARFLAGRGLGVRREAPELQRWECGQSTVALILYNGPEYIESMLGCFRARVVPINVNHHYRPEEIRGLLEMVDARAVVYHRRLGSLVGAAVTGRSPVLIDVDDASGNAPLDGSTSFEEAVASDSSTDLPVPSPDDLYVVCTGGTTGSPKAVLWRQGDIFESGMGGAGVGSREALKARVAAGGSVWFAAPPLMHAAAQWTAFAALHGGGTVVLHDDSVPFDARRILETVARERVNLVSIVGDAFARPLIEELRRRDHDLSALATIATGGAITSDSVKEELLEFVPHVTIVDGYGSSETGGMAFGASARGQKAASFAPGGGAAVLSSDRSRFLMPGEDEVGWTARRGRVPLGYLGDREKTEATFPIIDGQRVAVPGDRARLREDGTIVLLGRDSMVVNSGGEKIFVEEVEEALRAHPAVADAVVVGRPSPRFGEEVVAVVAFRSGQGAEPAALREFAAGSIARFKCPRAVAVRSDVRRLPTGKPDYAWAREVAKDAVSLG